MIYRVGCAGWNYKQWNEIFFMKEKSNGSLLTQYASVFDAVEIDSTFYGIPSESTVSKWKSQVPQEFQFSPKLPSEITHQSMLLHTEQLVEKFCSRMKLLNENLGPILIQLPPYFNMVNHFPRLETFIESLPAHMEFALEIRNNTLNNSEVRKLLKKNDVTLANADSGYSTIEFKLNQNTEYIRLVGDRSIGEDQFGKLVRNADENIDRMVKLLKRSDAEIAYIFANNHYEGFGPETARKVLKFLDQKEKEWPSQKNKKTNQKTLF